MQPTMSWTLAHMYCTLPHHLSKRQKSLSQVCMHFCLAANILACVCMQSTVLCTCVGSSVIFVNENENENEKDQQFVHENEN